MPATLIAVDVAKSVFEIAVSTQPGRIAERHRPTRLPDGTTGDAQSRCAGARDTATAAAIAGGASAAIGPPRD